MTMALDLDSGATQRLRRYIERLGGLLKDRRKRESFAIYALGILAEGERKSVEPIAARACGDPDQTRRMHEKLLHFVGGSEWNDAAVRLEAARHVCQAMAEREPVTTWVVDDTGFLKQGRHSVGVQRQYTGSAGKITNCQIGVSLEIATASQHAPIDFELYLPEGWVNDPERRVQARIPEEVTFQSKPELALAMIERAKRAGIPGEILLADSGYGENNGFRRSVRELGLDYAVGIQSQTKVRRVGSTGRLGTALSVGEVAKTIPHRRRRMLRWREGTRATLEGRFSFCRVKTTHADGVPIEEREAVWLVIEWRSDDDPTPKFYLTTLPRRMSHKQLVRIIKERWRTERMYEDLKGELGLDHFEGRSFVGWHHHVSVVLCCYAFVVAEQMRAFPPSSRGQSFDPSLENAA
ncbi:MAG TPA: IS701 family transposase [Polyangiaceae bacterium]|nr:IS701 family transposase [Polyangiaceae bacterium]